MFSRQLFPTRQGLGIEFETSVPITASQWQTLELSLLTADSLTTRGWDLIKGQVALSGEWWRSCGISLPNRPANGRGSSVMFLAGLSRTAPVASEVTRGAWSRMRIQLFPDGRCGLALNGEPLLVLDQAVPMGDSAMVMIGGFSYRTRILIGPLEVWRGVRRDVDWSRAEAGGR